MDTKMLFRIWVAVLYLINMCKAELNYSDAQTLNALVSASLSKNNIVIGVFCLPWYEQCEILRPELELVLEALRPWPSAKLLLINCEVESDACSSYRITSYPTVRLFHGPKQIRYRGKFRASSITTEVLKTILPPVSRSNRQILDTLKSLDIPLLLFTESEDDTSQSSTVITQVAEKLHGKLFVTTTHDLTLAEEEGAKLPFIVVLNSLDEVKPVYQGKVQIEPILKFAEMASTPLIGRLDLKSYIKYTQSGLPLAFILAGIDEERRALAESLKHIALNYKGRVNFVTVDTKSLSFLLEPLGVDGRRLPAFALHRGDNDEVFVYDQNRKVNAKDVEVFMQRTLNWPDKEL
ncbi:uncharacterized protein Z519_10162 [Cladophialophora bantiana CBS 173.52]|uniref:Protein disulfide-isomerase n=1 Tax=Cladophialophora bantiana (strain ATCC 10958 / CBS 173.52 / CDC B-1940 / NIH 8579) TaxID=1442370 RepID=A0A0D2HXI0_CLAB1|nr:uncharacterized protein Z519_10162 [Cladophialophora bantiana CBS 173.52]KIW89309.1 hypothetical protein Z519_10162 [Cladophialophora bantiana CBS 173.52]